MVFKNLEEAVEALKRDPSRPVRAQVVDDLDLELRAVGSKSPPVRLGEFLSSLGPWEGESTAELHARLKEARASGGSSEPPRL
jgi:hypothetical protein